MGQIVLFANGVVRLDALGLAWAANASYVARMIYPLA